MNKVVYLFFAVLLASSFSSAQMKLYLPESITGETQHSYLNHNLESNMKLQLPETVYPPSDAMNFVRGMWIVGILADATIPLGDDFTHVAGTGFSGHAMAAYVLNEAFLLSLRAGYVKYGGQSSEDEYGSYEDDFSEIPILLGAYYLISTQGNLKPYIGLALGIYMQSYSYKWQYSYFGQHSTEEGDNSETNFGLVPELGVYYFLSAAAIIQAAVTYNYVFAKLGESSSMSSVSILAGVAFPLGGQQ